MSTRYVIPEPIREQMDKTKYYVPSDSDPTTSAVKRAGGIAYQDQSDPNAVAILNPRADDMQAVLGHEAYHAMVANMPPTEAAKIPQDDYSDTSKTYDISDVDKWRAQGKTITELPQEKAARIVERYIKGDAATRKQLQPWIDDLNSMKQSTIEPNRPGMVDINTVARPPAGGQRMLEQFGNKGPAPRRPAINTYSSPSGQPTQNIKPAVPDQDPISEFIALPRDQQLSTLRGLSPEKQDRLLAKVKERRGASKGLAPRKAQPAMFEPHPDENPVAAFFRGGAASFVNLARHPIQTAESQGEPFLAANQSVGGGYPALAPLPFSRTGREAEAANEQAQQGARSDTAEQGKEMAQHPAYSAGGIILPALLTEGVARGVRGLAPRVRVGAQGLVGAGEKPVAAMVAREATEAGEAAKSAIKSNREAASKSAADTAEVRAANKEAVRAQEKIKPTQEKLQAAGRELQAQIETAREKAKTIGDAKYSGVNEKLSHLPANMEGIHNLYQEASNSIGEAQSAPPVLTRIGEVLEHGDALSYKDEQALYSELGKELTKGTLPGGTFHAYDLLHEGIGADMQRIADSQGQGAQLTDARNYWRRMKQTFGKPYNPTDAGNVTLERATGQAAAEEQDNRVRLLGSFDPSIPQTVEHIGNLRKGLESLPSEKPLRDVVKPLPAKPEPKQIHPTEVNTRAIREQLLDRWSSGESQLSKFQVRSLVGRGLGALLGGLFEGKLGAGIGGAIGGSLGPVAIARLVEVPAVREWLTRPPAGELETLRKLPSADRLRITDTLGRVVDQSARTGKPIRLSPKAAALIGGASSSSPAPRRDQNPTPGLAPRRQEQNPTDAWANPQQ